MGVDRAKMRMYDVDQLAQKDITVEEDAPAFDKTKIGKRDFSEIVI